MVCIMSLDLGGGAFRRQSPSAFIKNKCAGSRLPPKSTPPIPKPSSRRRKQSRTHYLSHTAAWGGGHNNSGRRRKEPLISSGNYQRGKKPLAPYKCPPPITTTVGYDRNVAMPRTNVPARGQIQLQGGATARQEVKNQTEPG